jgi:hypothetical protein
MIFKTTSHRSRDRLQSKLGRKPQYRWTMEQGGRFVSLTTPEDIAAAKSVPGVTVCRDQDEKHYGVCWS